MDFSKIDSLEAIGCKVQKNEPLCGHTTFKIGGPADRFVTVFTEKQLSETLKTISESSIPYVIFGKGSNLLVSDKGFRGVVLVLAGGFKEIALLEDKKTIRCGGAVLLSSLCTFAKENELTGIEFAWGIPGSVGGAVFMNAGAYGGEIRDSITKAEHCGISGTTGSRALEELELDYRTSVYQKEESVITFAEFRLKKGNKAEISAKMEELMNKRVSKQPYDMPSCGSTFKRPVGAFAAALIEECGLKGYTNGKAQVSEKHAGFVINTGGAVCQDVLNVIEHVKKTVMEKKQIQLECEVKMIGEGF